MISSFFLFYIFLDVPPFRNFYRLNLYWIIINVISEFINDVSFLYLKVQLNFTKFISSHFVVVSPQSFCQEVEIREEGVFKLIVG